MGGGRWVVAASLQGEHWSRSVVYIPARVSAAEVRDHRHERSLPLAPLGGRSEALGVQLLESVRSRGSAVP